MSASAHCGRQAGESGAPTEVAAPFLVHGDQLALKPSTPSRGKSDPALCGRQSGVQTKSEAPFLSHGEQQALSRRASGGGQVSRG